MIQYVVEVKVVDVESKSELWKEIARFNRAEDAEKVIKRNKHCFIRAREVKS